MFSFIIKAVTVHGRFHKNNFNFIALLFLVTVHLLFCNINENTSWPIYIQIEESKNRQKRTLNYHNLTIKITDACPAITRGKHTDFPLVASSATNYQ